MKASSTVRRSGEPDAQADNSSLTIERVRVATLKLIVQTMTP